MIARQTILELVQRIARRFAPERIILFGSYAYGAPTNDSDVDLLVILPFEGQGVHKTIEILDAIEPRIPLDLIVRTPAEVQQRLTWNDFFLREIIEKGQVLYESADARMD